MATKLDTIANHDIIERLFAPINYERQSPIAPGDFKLSNMYRLLERLGNPHLTCPVIHVAGTKGKGSVCTMIGSILSQAGYRTGIYNSPHLERINQRIIVEGKEVTDADLTGVLKKIEPTLAELDAEAERNETKKLTFFEVITSAAFQLYSDFGLDAVILEVGMGGRLDSTNVCQPEVSVITNISLDHTRQLGSTVDKIAAEKGGIIKAKVPVVSGVTNSPAREVIQSIAAQNDSTVLELDRDFKTVTNHNQTFSCFGIDQLQCGLRGSHQRENAALAIATCHVLRESGWKITDADIHNGIAAAKLPGRCEVFQLQSDSTSDSDSADSTVNVILDIAHNEASTTALANALESEVKEFSEAKPTTLLFAASREKDVAAMLKPLLRLVDHVILTKYQDNPRGRSVTELFKITNELVNQLSKTDSKTPTISQSSNPATAWHLAWASSQTSNSTSAICVTGSAFLIAELRPTIMNHSPGV